MESPPSINPSTERSGDLPRNQTPTPCSDPAVVIVNKISLSENVPLPTVQDTASPNPPNLTTKSVTSPKPTSAVFVPPTTLAYAPPVTSVGTAHLPPTTSGTSSTACTARNQQVSTNGVSMMPNDPTPCTNQRVDSLTRKHLEVHTQRVASGTVLAMPTSRTSCTNQQVAKRPTEVHTQRVVSGTVLAMPTGRTPCTDQQVAKQPVKVHTQQVASETGHPKVKGTAPQLSIAKPSHSVAGNKVTAASKQPVEIRIQRVASTVLSEAKDTSATLSQVSVAKSSHSVAENRITPASPLSTITRQPVEVCIQQVASTVPSEVKDISAPLLSHSVARNIVTPASPLSTITRQPVEVRIQRVASTVLPETSSPLSQAKPSCSVAGNRVTSTTSSALPLSSYLVASYGIPLSTKLSHSVAEKRCSVSTTLPLSTKPCSSASSLSSNHSTLNQVAPSCSVSSACTPPLSNQPSCSVAGTPSAPFTASWAPKSLKVITSLELAKWKRNHKLQSLPLTGVKLSQHACASADVSPVVESNKPLLQTDQASNAAAPESLVTKSIKNESSLILRRLAGALGRMESSSSDEEESQLTIVEQADEVPSVNTESSEDSDHSAPMPPKSVKGDPLSLPAWSPSSSSVSRCNPTGLHLKPASLPPLTMSSSSPVSADEGYLSGTPHNCEAILPFSNFLKSLSGGDLKHNTCTTSSGGTPSLPPALIFTDGSVPDIAREVKVESQDDDKIVQEILVESRDFDGYSSEEDVPVLMLSNGDVVAVPSEPSTSQEPHISRSAGVEDLETKSEPEVSHTDLKVDNLILFTCTRYPPSLSGVLSPSEERARPLAAS